VILTGCSTYCLVSHADNFTYNLRSLQHTDIIDPLQSNYILCWFVQPSESNTYADIEAVYEFLQTQYGVSQEDLILYGQSVGSGPTLHLAAKLPRLRGVVLHSSILSGLRVLCHVKFTFCFDIYKVSRLTWSLLLIEILMVYWLMSTMSLVLLSLLPFLRHALVL
jgi:pimeloyl-ACP methyl ester carboxylesterase